MTVVTTETALFINRELSWLAFNERVLEEAADPSTPLLERLKFAAIARRTSTSSSWCASPAVKHAIEDERSGHDPAGLTPASSCRRSPAGHTFVDSLYAARQRHPARAGGAGIRLVPSRTSTSAARALGRYFRDAVLPVLTPLAIDVSRPFPLLSSLSLNLALLLDPAPGERRSGGSRSCRCRPA